MSSDLSDPIFEAEAARRKAYDRIVRCQACPLRATARAPVPGRGLSWAVLVLVGEAPGEQEDEYGVPFVGRSGALLMQALRRACIPWRDVYITNVVRCRPPGNRAPLPDEVEACRHHLVAELALSPKAALVALGKTAADALALGEGSMARRRQRPWRFGDRVAYVTWHPSYILRSGGLESHHFEELVADLRSAYEQAVSQEGV